MKCRFRFRLLLALSLVALVSPLLMHGQFAKKGAAGAAVSSGDSAEIVSRGDNPVIRYAVAHQHAASGCGGYLYFSRDKIRYEVVGPEADKGHSFEFARADLMSAGQWRFWGSALNEAELKFRHGGVYHFFHVRKEMVEKAAQSAKLQWADVLSYQDLVNAATSFDNTLAMLEAREVRQRPAAPAPPPTISMLEPSGVEAGKTVDVSRAGLHLRGIASHASGIASVSVNGQAAFLKTLAPQTVEFDVQNIPVNPGLSAIVVLTTATDKTTGQLIFTANRAEVRVLDPASNSETPEALVKIRGLALGFHDVEKVEIGGVGAVLRKRDGGEVEFEAERVPLTVGNNTLLGFVMARSGVRENFQVDVKRLPPAGPPPLTLLEVQEALTGGVPATRVSSLVTKFGVDFTLNDDAEKKLRAAGADSNLLLVIARAKK